MSHEEDVVVATPCESAVEESPGHDDITRAVASPCEELLSTVPNSPLSLNLSPSLSPFPPMHDVQSEICSVKKKIADVEEEIVETKTEAKAASRSGNDERFSLWMMELNNLRQKEDRLRHELQQLRAKEARLQGEQHHRDPMASPSGLSSPKDAMDITTPDLAPLVLAPLPHNETKTSRPLHAPGDAVLRTQEIVNITNTLTESLTTGYMSKMKASELRFNYLRLIERPTWKEELLEVAHIIAATNHIAACSGPAVGPDWGITVRHSGSTSVFSKKAITIGRLERNDVVLPESSQTCSRLHAVIFAIPEKRRLVVCDVGSCAGVLQIARGKKKERTKMKAPFFDYEWGEPFILKLGEETLVVNPKQCVVCLDRPREVLFACGHYACCTACSIQVRGTCPLCRKSGGIAQVSAVHTLVSTGGALNPPSPE
eukprot:Sspe_Gene.2275::Locus_753_Transcript_1_1_Confidence_1.000_Length_1446::g.2275::m.2275